MFEKIAKSQAIIYLLIRHIGMYFKKNGSFRKIYALYHQPVKHTLSDCVLDRMVKDSRDFN